MLHFFMVLNNPLVRESVFSLHTLMDETILLDLLSAKTNIYIT